jgi:hypothetical protein
MREKVRDLDNFQSLEDCMDPSLRLRALKEKRNRVMLPTVSSAADNCAGFPAKLTAA